MFLEHVHKTSIKAKSEVVPGNTPTEDSTLVAVFAEKPDWTLPYLAYLSNGELPSDEVVARQVVRRDKAYTIMNGLLYKHSATRVFQHCVSPEEGQEILREIHAGECGHHASSKVITLRQRP